MKNGRSVLTLTLLAGAVVVGSGTGCSSEDADDPSSPSCVSTREFFTTQVYGKALTACAGCHTPGGAAGTDEQHSTLFTAAREGPGASAAGGASAMSVMGRYSIEHPGDATPALPHPSRSTTQTSACPTPNCCSTSSRSPPTPPRRLPPRRSA